MIIHPCCGQSLRNGTRTVAILEFFTSAGFFLGGLISLQKFANASNVGVGNESGADVPTLLFGIAYLIFALIQFILAGFLLYGVNTKNYRHALKWFIGAWMLLLILIIFATCETYQGRLTPAILWAKPVILGFTSLLKLYCIWIVYEFIKAYHQDGSGSEIVKRPVYN